MGTLDQLVGLSDDLGKLDTFVDTVTHKVAVYLGEVLEDQRDKLAENLMANNSKYCTQTYFVQETLVANIQLTIEQVLIDPLKLFSMLTLHGLHTPGI